MFKRKYSKQFDKEYNRFCELNSQIADKIDRLMEIILAEPRGGLAHPERLRHKDNETWSRHIDRKNRLVYTIEDDTVYFERCEGHYDDH
ncbi:MAG: Txe/YoeB family addiction module toxin [Puniceicoccales bacterium]|jgi:toxin YoeB|nr:Txe/YoeB family addiction module toxin [Puniceicoccales bacterium]